MAAIALVLAAVFGAMAAAAWANGEGFLGLDGRDGLGHDALGRACSHSGAADGRRATPLRTAPSRREPFRRPRRTILQRFGPPIRTGPNRVEGYG